MRTPPSDSPSPTTTRTRQSETTSSASWSRNEPKCYFGKDANIPAAWEPGGADFFSPALIEADLMRRVLPQQEFRTWFAQVPSSASRGAGGDVHPSYGNGPE